ncbi:C1 family peptidase [Halosquirtibacter laminarini]|uniref:C1 family peptidase n=1 Tax=Halosquirtibacter laminarini TaxID=3374600 RepID=A0AC61NF48_9BACT|nr:C1 family peptidase [Prolixibacteraceae bacterium]
MKQLRLDSILLLFATLLTFSSSLYAKDKNNEYKNIYYIKNTSVKNQQKTGTCWCFSTVSFLESEIIKSQNKELDLSEMFLVKEAYHQKIENYVLRQGKANFGQGGQAHDVIDAIQEKGLTPQSAFKGNTYGKVHNHTKLVEDLTAELNKDNSKKVLEDNWLMRADNILDQYFGKEPTYFDYEGKHYTAKSFLASLNILLNDYIELTSYTHHPFNEKFILEIPDNWKNGEYYNVPIDRFMNIIDVALEKGYSVVWDGDVSEKTFQHSKGVAFIPKGTDVSQKARQTTFYNKKTTDDHLMHLVGKAEKDGVFYYIIKNSWDTNSNSFGGYLYMSEDFVRLKTVAIMINKNALSLNEHRLLDIK